MSKILENEIKIIINYFNANDLNKTLELSKKILKKNPENDFILNIVGLCYQKFTDYEKAKNFFIQAISINKRNISALTNYSNNLKYTFHYSEAKKFYQKALDINTNHIPALINFANLNYLINKNSKAIELLEKANNLNNNLIPVHLNLAIVYQSLGNFKKAIYHLDKINEIDPSFTRADKIKSVLVNYNENNNHLEEMMQKLQKLKLTDNQKVYLYFSISKAFEDLKDFTNAFKFMKQGNDLKFKKSNYNVELEIEKSKKIIEIFNKSDPLDNDKIIQDKIPIFIIGMPRSGTSLLENILSSHGNVEGLGELNVLNNIANKEFLDNQIFNNLDLKKKNIENIAEKYSKIIKAFEIDKVYYTDKTLLNFNWVGVIKNCFPKSKIIHCFRNPKDNLLSIYKNYFDHEGDWCYDEKVLIKYYKNYLNIINYWKKQFPDHIYNLKYEDLVEDPLNNTKNLLNFCGLGWDDNCLNFYNNHNTIKTLSVKQARSKIYKSSVNTFENYKTISKDLFKEL